MLSLRLVEFVLLDEDLLLLLLVGFLFLLSVQHLYSARLAQLGSELGACEAVDNGNNTTTLCTTMLSQSCTDLTPSIGVLDRCDSKYQQLGGSWVTAEGRPAHYAEQYLAVRTTPGDTVLSSESKGV